MTKRTEAEIIEEIQDVECRLSPENLAGDGENTQTWIKKEGTRLRALRAKLVAELGREPTCMEIYGY